MISIKEIEEKITSCEDLDLPENMVGAAFYTNSDGSPHAAIFLRYNGDSQLFHFTGTEVLIEPISPQEPYFQKSLEFLDPILLPAFFAHCELILEKAEPKFGYFYEGALYNSDGNFISPNDAPEYMTCVGFCLNVIKGFLSDQDFFNYQDWDESSLEGKLDHVEGFLLKVRETCPDINIADFKVNLRRIVPIEFISGAFSDSLPVRKVFTDSIVENVDAVLKSKKVA